MPYTGGFGDFASSVNIIVDMQIKFYYKIGLYGFCTFFDTQTNL